jgi:hypothetical protein
MSDERRGTDTHPAFLKPAGPNLGLAPPRGAEAPRRGMFASLAHRPYRRYWTGLFLSNVGTWMQNVAQGWLVLRPPTRPSFSVSWALRGRSRHCYSPRSPAWPRTG